jgi:hypothetical protein
VQYRESQSSAVTEEMKNLASIHPLETAVKRRSNFHSLICTGSVERVIQEATLLEKNNQGEEKLKYIMVEHDSIGFTPLHSAVCLLSSDSKTENSALKVTTVLLAAGADVFQVDGFGNTALHWAARSGNSEVIQLLAIHGCTLGKKKRS